VYTAGLDNAISMKVAGITRRDAYLTEDRKTLLRVSGSFSGLTLEKTGKSVVVTGVTKKVTMTEKFMAAW